MGKGEARQGYLARVAQMPLTHPEKQKQRLVCVMWVAFLVVVVGINLHAVSLIHVSSPARVYHLQGGERAIAQMKLWPQLVQATQQDKSFATQRSGARDVDLIYLEDCWNDSDWLRMYQDPYCTFLWMKALTHGHVRSLERVLSVITQRERKMGEQSKSNQNGGMRCVMDGFLSELQMMGYWKPCTTQYLPGNSETFKSEIVAFHVDRLLGFYRTPPVVPVYFNVTQLRQLSWEAASRARDPDKEALYKIQTVMDKCGTSRGAEGAMVGWSNLPLRVLDRTSRRLRAHRFVNMLRMGHDSTRALQENEFNITRQSPSHKISWALENAALNMFVILMGNPQKFAHSVFVLERTTNEAEFTGPLLYVDNDRSSWDNDIFRRGLVKPNHPLSVLCKFPLEVATRILAVNESEGFTVGELLRQSVAGYEATMKEAPLFTPENAHWLDQRVRFLRQMIEQCIHQHGVEDVLIPEPWYHEYFHEAEMWTKSIPANWMTHLYSSAGVSADVLSRYGIGVPLPPFHTANPLTSDDPTAPSSSSSAGGGLAFDPFLFQRT